MGGRARGRGGSGFNGKGSLVLTLHRQARTAEFSLTYSGLSSPVTVAHIHFGKVHVAGGVIVFFCGGGGQGDCPASGTVTGTITAANVQAIASQNVQAGDFDALEDALTSNTAYANVHTSNFPAGEIRGQIHGAEDDTCSPLKSRVELRRHHPPAVTNRSSKVNRLWLTPASRRFRARCSGRWHRRPYPCSGRNRAC